LCGTPRTSYLLYVNVLNDDVYITVNHTLTAIGPFRGRRFHFFQTTTISKGISPSPSISIVTKFRLLLSKITRKDLLSSLRGKQCRRYGEIRQENGFSL
jgi:hypothetical protein